MTGALAARKKRSKSDGSAVHMSILSSGFDNDTSFSGRIATTEDLTGSGMGGDDMDGFGTSIIKMAAGTDSLAATATIHMYKVFEKDRGRVNWAVAALNKVMKSNHQPGVVFLPISFNVGQALVNKMIKQVAAQGIIIVAPAGNDRRDACGVTPGMNPEVITVGGLTDTMEKWGPSNYGECVDVWAKGTTESGAVGGTAYSAARVASAVASMLCGSKAMDKQAILDQLGKLNSSSITVNSPPEEKYLRDEDNTENVNEDNDNADNEDVEDDEDVEDVEDDEEDEVENEA